MQLITTIILYLLCFRRGSLHNLLSIQVCLGVKHANFITSNQTMVSDNTSPCCHAWACIITHHCLVSDNTSPCMTACKLKFDNVGAIYLRKNKKIKTAHLCIFNHRKCSRVSGQFCHCQVKKKTSQKRQPQSRIPTHPPPPLELPYSQKN